MKSARLVAYLVALSAMASGLAGCATTARYLGQHQQIGPVSLLEQRTGNILMTVCMKQQSGYSPVDPKSDKPIAGGSGRYRHGVLLSGCSIVNDFYAKLNKGSAEISPPQTGDKSVASSASVRLVILPASAALTPTEAREMLEDGIVLSDAACFNWFQQLDGARRASGAAAGFTSGITTLTNVVQGQTGVESAAIAIVAATGRAVTDGFSNFDSNYLLAPSLPDIYDAIQQNRRQLADEYLHRSDVRDKVSAVRYLQYYERACTSIGVQQFLSKALLKAGDPSNTTTLTVEASLAATASVVAGELHEPSVLYESDLTYLALLWEVLPDEEKSYIAARADETEAAAAATKATAAEKAKADENLKSATKTKDGRKAAYDKVSAAVEPSARNRIVSNASTVNDKKLFDYAATRTKTAAAKKATDVDKFSPTSDGSTAKSKLEASEIHPRIRKAAEQLYIDMQGK